ncbi:hypothetical protein ACS0TY_011547 [Phlomoides rotata]
MNAASAPCSPQHRHKFFCSHGGKILPRPADGQLKYVGGETRCISAPRGIPFREVMKRLTYLIDGEMILKYQLLTEDLDALVSVKSEEDVVHMFDEMEHYEIAGCPRMRAFLFPLNHAPPMMDNPIPVEQHYIYSINGINTNQLSSSASTSPTSPDTCISELINTESLSHNNYQNSNIQGSPTTCSNLNNTPHQQYYNSLGRNAAAAAQERLVSVRSVGRSDSDHCFYGSREINQSCAKCIMHHEDHRGRFYDARILERQATLPAHF